MIIQKLKVAIVVGLFSIIMATFSIYNFLTNTNPEIISWFSGKKSKFTPTEAVENKKFKNKPETNLKKPTMTSKPEDKKKEYSNSNSKN